MKNVDRQIKRIVRYEANVEGILLAYKEAFDGSRDFQTFVEITAATIEAAMGIIREIEQKYALMPEHMKGDFAKQQQEEWYNAVINNPISYSMDNTNLKTICDTIFSWLTDDERLLIARRGIVNRIVYNRLLNDNFADKSFNEEICTHNLYSDVILRGIFGEYLSCFLKEAATLQRGSQVAELVNDYVKKYKLEKNENLNTKLRVALENRGIKVCGRSRWNDIIKNKETKIRSKIGSKSV